VEEDAVEEAAQAGAEEQAGGNPGGSGMRVHGVSFAVRRDARWRVP
jgi:hypothetical protein